ncbi:discoidin domain-containing protein [Kineosporia succinea]|uniref:NAD glycohydrolase translocation F5/8 type C domain-containing protein n=1 Tax=Kineosporia succinea TaxID=84632 RepID=A0ABT9P5A8_9ACTN|nr:discoidin domain-containing protein [Kineosporia succinea]MDP9827874.1 hypothetical protein [Kineosporia succinea]
MNCTRCGAAYLQADPECPRCGLALRLSGATTAGPVPAAPPGAYRTSERPLVVRGAGLVAVLLSAFLVLQFVTRDSEVSSSWKPQLPADLASPSTAPRPTGVNLATGAVVTAEETDTPQEDGAGDLITYDASNMVDGDLTTAWRVATFYNGRAITIDLKNRSQITQVGLTNGYTKVDGTNGNDAYEMGRKILQVTWMFDDGTSVRQKLADDVRTIQYQAIEPVQAQRVTLRIDSTSTPGHALSDYTAITELFVGS